MNKLSLKNNIVLLASAVLAVGGFLVSVPQALAALSGEDLTANLALADFLAIGSRWFNYLLLAFIVIIIVYGIYYFIKRKKK